jgi:hypothetical protein
MCTAQNAPESRKPHSPPSLSIIQRALLIENSYIIYQKFKNKDRGLIVPSTILLRLHSSLSQLVCHLVCIPAAVLNWYIQEPALYGVAFVIQGNHWICRESSIHCFYHLHTIPIGRSTGYILCVVLASNLPSMRMPLPWAHPPNETRSCDACEQLQQLTLSNLL